MKKLIIIVLMLSLILTTFGCGKEEDKVDDKSNIKSTQLASFESLDEMYTLAFTKFVGKVSKTKDAKYVTHGNEAIEMRIDYTTDDAWPSFSKDILTSPSIRLSSLNANLALTDISEVERFCIDVFNANARESYITMQAFSGVTEVYSGISKLKANSKNEVTFAVNRLFAADNWATISEYAISIYDDKLNDGASSYYYFDNFRAVSGIEKALIPENTHSNGEILTFTSPIDMKYLQSYNTTAIPASYYSYAPNGALKLSYIGTTGSNGKPITEFYADGQKSGVTILPAYLKTLNLDSSKTISVYLRNNDSVARSFRVEARGYQETVSHGAFTVKTIPANTAVIMELNLQELGTTTVSNLEISCNTYDIFHAFNAVISKIEIKK